jgi:hypothetical protein
MKLKNLFVKEDENAALEEAVKEVKGKNSIQPTSISSSNTLATPNQFASATVSAAEKNEFAEFLNGIYKEANFPGPDYQEFTDAINEMASSPMDEKTKFQAIYAGFKVQGCYRARLLETGSKYIVKINEQVDGFNAEIEKTLNTEVAAKQNKAMQIAKENDTIEQQMIALTEKKNKNIESIQKLTSEANEQASALNIKKSSFKLAADEFIAVVQSNMNKIQTYLPEK